MRSAESESPVGDAEFARLIAPVAGRGPIVLAVSGGADSLALLYLVARWRQALAAPPDVHVLTVDHGLRPESGAEARAVAAAAAAFGLAHEILVWDGDKPATGVEAAARAARYRLLLQATRRIGARHLLVAHHRDDQAETFLMRLARGSGVYGLAAMRPRVAADGVIVVRPFLSVAKSRLEATVRAAGLKPAEDETNRDRRFARARLRRLMPVLAGEGLGSGELAAAAARMARAGDALDRITDRLIAAAVTVDALALVRVDWRLVAAEPEEIRLRLLARLIVALGGSPARSVQVESLLAGLDAGRGRKQTLGGVVFAQAGPGLLAWRELGRTGLPELVPGDGFDSEWDGRFRVALAKSDGRALRISALGDAAPLAAGSARGFRRQAIAALPALFEGPELLAVPSLGFAVRPELGFRTECLVAARLTQPRQFPDFGRQPGRKIHHIE